MVIGGSFKSGKLFGFISAHLWFNLDFYFSLENFFVDKVLVLMYFTANTQVYAV
jgi:hypothetical protein